MLKWDTLSDLEVKQRTVDHWYFSGHNKTTKEAVEKDMGWVSFEVEELKVKKYVLRGG